MRLKQCHALPMRIENGFARHECRSHGKMTFIDSGMALMHRLPVMNIVGEFVVEKRSPC